MKNSILELMEDGISLKNIYRKLEIKDETKQKAVKKIITSLEEKGCIYYDEDKNKYKYMPSNRFVTDILATKKGAKYILVGKNQVLLKSDQLNGAIMYDKVLIEIKNGEYIVDKIINREKSNFICELTMKDSKYKIVAVDKDISCDIYIDKEDLEKLNIGDIFIINPSKNINHKGIYGKLDKILCNKVDPDHNIITICTEYGFRYEFSEKSIEEANNLPKEVEYEGNRKDLRDELIYTIDCEQTKDIDDAISISYENDIYILKIHIAHVSHYVPLSSSMFEDAILNTTSIYPPDKVIPMFPHKLSSGICSLNPNVDRLARTTEMHFDKEGNLIDFKTYKSIINSKKKMTYNEVNSILEDNVMVEGYEDFESNLKLAYKLSLLMTKQKYLRDYLQFDSNELIFNYDNNGKIESVESVNLGIAEELIENFMVATNSTLTQLAPISYRNHEAPKKSQIDAAIETIKKLDFKLPESNNVSNKKYLQIILDNLDTDEEKIILSKIILRSFNRASYDVLNKSHFGLGLDYYAHTTSPIRRIVDYINQVIIDLCEEENLTEEKFNEINITLEYVCKMANEKERLADMVEYKSSLIEMAKYMEDKIGNEYTMFISEITPTYVKVSAKNLLEGVINIENFIGDNVYYTNEENLKSSKNNWVYKIGHYLKVKVLNVEIVNGIVNYTMEENITRKNSLENKKIKIKSNRQNTSQ